jgi:hypothetical protein
VLVLHGTFWSCVWRPVVARIAGESEVFAPDYPSFGSGGWLGPEEAAVPNLASLVLRFADALAVGSSPSPATT